MSRWRMGGAAGVLVALVVLMAMSGGASAQPNLAFRPDAKAPPVSGVVEFRTAGAEVPAEDEVAGLQAPEEGSRATSCPQAGLEDARPQPLRGVEDRVERISARGNDIRVNQDYSCFPQNETSIAVNPTDRDNLVGGANDYRLGWASSGVYASTDGGDSWYETIIPFPSLPSGDNLDGGGDPVLVFDRDGVVYYLEINFNRTDDTGGVFVSRSTDGGFTWSRMCVPITGGGAPPRCGGTGDPRQPGDGVVTFTPDNDVLLNGSVPFDDKPWLAAGPRPAGVAPTCFDPVSRAEIPCANDVVSPDRLYVTWTRFADDAVIYLSHSDDGARSWSAPRAISGSAPFCVGGEVFGGEPDACNNNQFSVPTASPVTGALYVSWQNFNTPDENQYLVTSSTDGGQTFDGPFFVSNTFDANYPRVGTSETSTVAARTDCAARGQQNGRAVLTNSCFRVNSGGNVVVDRRGGEFADDLYLVFSDNRNGTRESSNTDVFLFTSDDGGATWIGPTRVNDDRSEAPPDRDCLVGEAGCRGDFGNDQWFPWVDIGLEGELNVVFSDRRLDTDSMASEWPSSRTRPGNYLVWHAAAQCQVTESQSRECLSESATAIPQPDGPVDPGEGPVPGQAQPDAPLANLIVSDHPSNFDYGFRAGIFLGDYNNVTVSDGEAITLWTDARNGRSSRQQPGRNPPCEQSDVFLDRYEALNGRNDGRERRTDDLFLVTPCP